MFIVSKLDVNNKLVELVDENYDSEEEAFKFIMNIITEDDNKFYVNKIKNNQYIEVFKVNKGIIYNTRQLIMIYQILKVPE